MDLEAICKKLEYQGVKTVNLNRIKNIANEFVTTEAFFRAKKSDIMGVWNKLNPNVEYSLGNHFFEAYDKALRLWRGCDGDEQENDVEAPKACAPKDDPAWLLHELTLEEVKKVSDFMEMFQVKRMSFQKIATLLDLTGVNVPKSAEFADSDGPKE